MVSNNVCKLKALDYNIYGKVISSEGQHLLPTPLAPSEAEMTSVSYAYPRPPAHRQEVSYLIKR